MLPLHPLVWLIVNRKMPEFTLRKWYYQFPLLGWPWVFGLAIASINIIFAGSGSMDSDIWFCSAWAGKWALLTCVSILGLGLLIIVFSMGSLIRVRNVVDVFFCLSWILTLAHYY